MTTTRVDGRPVGELVRRWRRHRSLTQLALSLHAEVSTRHLSFVESGRARPSREMLLHLAECLDIPLRERNHLLLAGGYAPVYSEAPLDAPEMSAVRDAIRRLLTSHEPYPALVVDQEWRLVDANASVAPLIAGVAPELMTPPVNVLRLSLHPRGMAPRIRNLGEWRAHLLGRLRRQVDRSGDAALADLLAELRGYPCDQPEPRVELPGPGDVTVPLRLEYEGRELTLLSMVATFGTPVDITVAELSIEAFYPDDPGTAAVLRAAATG